jgi:rare lipoprotein A
MFHLRHYAVAAIVFVLLASPAEARGWQWFVTHIKPGNQCSGRPIPTTYYGEGHHNADGSHFNPSGLSAASWDYPFGTVLEVTNCANGRSVNVVIKDRGPGRLQVRLGIRLDLSTGAARAIMLGQNGRFESGYTTHRVVSVGSGEVFSRHRNKGSHVIINDIAARAPYPF